MWPREDQQRTPEHELTDDSAVRHTGQSPESSPVDNMACLTPIYTVRWFNFRRQIVCSV